MIESSTLHKASIVRNKLMNLEQNTSLEDVGNLILEMRDVVSDLMIHWRTTNRILESKGKR